MVRFSLLLFLATPLVANGQPCEASPQVRAAIARQPAGRVIQQFPNDIWAHRAYQDTFREGWRYRQQVIDMYAGLLAKHPGDPAYLYLYGRTLAGTKTLESIPFFEEALARDPGNAQAHFSLVEIYSAPQFKDLDKARTHLEAFMNACPHDIQGFHSLKHMENSDFFRRQVARFRPLLEGLPEGVAISEYPLLWSLEFKARPAPEYGEIREEIRKDLVKLRKLDLLKNSKLVSTLRQGYTLVDDKDALKWLDEHAPDTRATQSSAAMQAYQEWNGSHPVPTSKPGQPVSWELLNARNKALLEATKEWVEKWPEADFAWQQRTQAIVNFREIPDAEVDRAAAGILTTIESGDERMLRLGQIAFLYVQRHMHLGELSEMVKGWMKELDKSIGHQSALLQNEVYLMLEVVEGYLETYQLDKAVAALADVRKVLNDAKPAGWVTGPENQNWGRSDAQYWFAMARLSEHLGRKEEALTFYENQIRALGSSDGWIESQVKTLWSNLGRPLPEFDAWLAKLAPPKPAAPAEWAKIHLPLAEFELTDMAGKTWRLADIKGKTTFINLWATWCGPCTAELPYLQKLYDKLKDRPDIRVITFNTDENPGLAETFVKQHKYTFPVLTAQSYVDRLAPSSSISLNWIVDEGAVVKLESIGLTGDADTWVDRMVEAILKAK